MDQPRFPISAYSDYQPMSVRVPQAWDGIGQALRAAYRDYPTPPDAMAKSLAELDLID